MVVLSSLKTSVNVDASDINNEYGDVQLAILPSSKSSVNIDASAINNENGDI